MLDPVTKSNNQKTGRHQSQKLARPSKKTEVFALRILGKLVRRTCRLFGLEVVAPAHDSSDFEYTLSLVRLTRRIQRCVRNQFTGAAVEHSVQKCGSDTTAASVLLAEDRPTVSDRPDVTVPIDRRIQ